MEPGILCIIFFLIHDFLLHIVHILLTSQPPKNLTLMLKLSLIQIDKKTMDEEFSALQLNQMWTLTSLPTEQKSIGCKWVYKIKYNSDGSVDRYKTRLVAKGVHSDWRCRLFWNFFTNNKINNFEVSLNLYFLNLVVSFLIPNKFIPTTLYFRKDYFISLKNNFW